MELETGLTDQPHRRYNPLLKEYVLVSPHRSKRPWLGQVEAQPLLGLPQYDPSCYLCPGNTRAGGQLNPDYTGTHSFENDFSAVLPSRTSEEIEPVHPLLQAEPVRGFCDVLIFHPRHDLTLARMDATGMMKIIDAWVSIYEQRGKQDGVKYIQIFENKGLMMGCSNPHPHGQVWSTSVVPSLPAKELESLLAFSLRPPTTESTAPKGPQGRPCLLCEYAHLEVNRTANSRLVVQNEDWIAIVPWWATWPFEVLALPYKRHIPSLSECSATEREKLAEILSGITTRYDNLFRCSFPYSMGIHQRPVPFQPDTHLDEDNVAHLHVHFTPPLLRSSTIRKFLVGFELMAEPQRDLTPEEAARRLRECASVHYLDAPAPLDA